MSLLRLSFGIALQQFTQTIQLLSANQLPGPAA